MAIPIGQLETFLLTQALKNGKKELSPSDKALLDTFKKMGLAKVSDDILAAIQAGDTQKAITLGRATIYAATSNFLVASTGISNGPLSKWLGMAMDALSEPDANKRNSKLRTVQSSIKSEDPELADAIDRFLKGSVDAIAILAARRAGADPKLMDIATGVTKGDVAATLQASANYAGMTPSQTGAVVAAYRLYTDKKVTQQTVDAAANFAAENVPDWKSAKQDVQAAYSLGVNVDSFIRAVNSGPSGFPLPKSIEDAKSRQDALIKLKNEGVVMMAGQQVAILAAIATLMVGAVGGVAVATFGSLYVLAALAISELQNVLGKELGFTGNKEEDVNYAKNARQALLDRNLIPPNLDTIGAQTPKAAAQAYDTLNRSIPPDVAIFGQSDMPFTYTRHMGLVRRAVADYLEGVKDFAENPEVKVLQAKCVMDGYGGPLTSSVCTKAQLMLASHVIALKYGVPADVPLLVFADNLSAPVCSKNQIIVPGTRSNDPVPRIRVETVKVSLDGIEIQNKVEILQELGYESKPPGFYADLVNWVLKLPDSRIYLPEGREVFRQRLAANYHFNDALDIATIVDNHRFYHRDSKDDTLNGWYVRAYYTTNFWGEIILRLQQTAKAYVQVTNDNKGPFGTRQQVGKQIALYMDIHPKALFNDAVKATIASADKNMPGVLDKLKTMGLGPTNLSFYWRQVRALLASGKVKTRQDAIVAIETTAGRPVPAKNGPGYAAWVIEKNNELKMSEAEASSTAPVATTSAPVATTAAMAPPPSAAGAVLTASGGAAVGFYVGGPIGAAVGATVGFLWSFFRQ